MINYIYKNIYGESYLNIIADSMTNSVFRLKELVKNPSEWICLNDLSKVVG